MQDGAAAHTANSSINALSRVSEDRVICYRLWPASTPDLNPCDFYLLGPPSPKSVLK